MEKIKFPHILIYDSSAGSGKTHQLALRYLHLLLISQPDIKHHINNLLAITFTNKSAQEMRKRIIEWIKRILLDLDVNENTGKKILSEIKNNISLNDREIKIIDLSESEIRNRINRVFQYVLKNYNDFKVSTIDSFVTLILKASSFKLGLSPDFEIVLNMDPYFNNTIDRIFQDILEKKEIRAVFDKFIENYCFIKQEKISWFPKDFIKDNIKEIWERIKQTGKNVFIEKDMLEQFDNEKIEIKDDLKKKTKSLFLNLLEEIKLKGLDINKNFLKKVHEYLEKENLSLMKKYTGSNLKGLLNKNSDLPSQKISRDWTCLCEQVSDFYIKQANYYYYHLIEIFQLFEENLYTEARFKNNIILIQELNNLLKDILKRAEDDPSFLPELYYYLSSRYHHFLIDEFQDTNYLQWQNLSILTEEALSSGGSLFVVGDKKQAIYNWRGASSLLLNEVGKNFNLGDVYHNSLDINFRSNPNIVWFNSRVFQAENIVNNFINPLKNFLKENINRVIDTYKNSDQKTITSGIKTGYVYIKKIVQDKLTVDEIKENIKEEFLIIIKNIKKRDIYQDKDICILCRKKKEVDDVVNWLLAEKINVESDTTVDIRNNPFINEILCLIEFLNNPLNNAAFINFLSGNIFRHNFSDMDNISDWYHAQLIQHKDVVLYKEFEKKYPKVWDDYFSTIFSYIGYLPTYEFVLLILKKWNVFQNFTEFAPYFLRLLEIIKNLEDTDVNIYHLLDKIYSDEDKELFLLNTGEGIDAVKVMTIHKAKGLEFPVIILPFSNLRAITNNMFFSESSDYLNIFRINKDDTTLSEELNYIYFNTRNQEMIEELNNLYVSFTRAKKELYVLLPQSTGVKNKLAPLIFQHPDFKPFIYEDELKIGNEIIEKEEKRKHEDFSDLNYENFEEDIKWFELLRTKVVKPEQISKIRFRAIKKGEMLHYILSLIDWFPDDKLDKKILQALHKFNIEDEENIKEDIKELLLSNFNKKEFNCFFQLKDEDKVYKEKDIVNSKGHLKRIDRFIVRENVIDVIDFKTGEEYQQEHTQQVKEYISLLKEIYPDKKINGYLCYLDEQLVKEV